MIKTTPSFAGADVSARWVDVAVDECDGKRRAKRFNNDASGHNKLCAWILKHSRAVRIVVEATGLYSLDLALRLHGSRGVEVMVANPRSVKNFARAYMQRSKTDRLDAGVICAFAKRMPFVTWSPPATEILDLRAIARRIASLTVERSRERCRIASLRCSRTSSAIVINDIEVNIRHLGRRIEQLTKQAMILVTEHPHLRGAFTHLNSVRGISTKSAVQMLPELLLLPKGLTAKQWVAHAGLDPRQYQSGSSIDRPTRISKVGNVHLRRILYMPALVAIRCEPNIRAFYLKLIERGKKPLVAIVAVMRKLLHSIHGMLKYDTDFDGEKFMSLAPVNA